LISVDTNVLVRILTGDDESQLRKALVLFENSEILFWPDPLRRMDLRHSTGRLAAGRRS